MAQAARLSLRMQKEIKLLLTDPPPGASFPILSLDSDISPSLSAIDAEISGPEGTVYAGGIFKLKIQIPERYPFQPPVVTFATQIYHPNIDNGGRICLDILNLPPKGAWQPSLNISTVLTSIGLLLSDPNPDDGLMCEASREYKYNRHTFDQKARSMTEKFATPGANGDGSSSKNSQSQTSASMVDRRSSNISTRELEDDSVSNKKRYGITSKLSLDCSKPLKNKEPNNGVNDKPIQKTNWPKEVCTKSVEEYYQHHQNLSFTKRKLSLGSLGHSEQKVDEKETLKNTQNPFSMNSLDIGPKEEISHNRERLPQRDADRIEDDNLSISNRKRLNLVSKRLSLGLSNPSQARETDNKENTAPAQSLPLQLNDNHGKLVINYSKNMGENGDFRIEQEPLGKSSGGNSEKQEEMKMSILSESVIVLDSEDSEEESQGSLRSRLLLARKRLPGKSKSKDSKPMV